MAINKFIFVLLAALACGGCTVVSANRDFPGVAWYWSASAQEQRRERALSAAPSKDWQGDLGKAVEKQKRSQ